MLLPHGTADDNAERIAKPGFDVRLRTRALYGHGVYLAMLMKTSRKMETAEVETASTSASTGRTGLAKAAKGKS